MDESRNIESLLNLVDESKDLPLAVKLEISRLIHDSQSHQQQLHQSVNDLQGALDTLRLSVKYQTFDLEATRRENALLRGQILQMDEEIARLNVMIANLKNLLASLGHTEFDDEPNKDPE